MLYSLETEKVNLDVDAEMDGYVKHTAEAGVMLAPGDVVGYIFADDEPIPADFAGVASPAAALVVDAPKAAAPAAVVSATPEPVAVVSGDGRLKSSPAARRLASEIGVAIAGLAGSGPGGRIVEADVRQASLQPGASTGAARQENVETKSTLRRRLMHPPLRGV